jgi:hypothetical protein
VQSDQRFCSRCGRQFGSAVAVPYPHPNRVQEHVRLLGVLWLVLAVLTAVGGIVLIILATTVFPHLQEMGAPPEMPTAFLHSLFHALGALLLLKAAACFLAGWGLMRLEPWARMLTIVLAFLALFNIPFGTALGIFTLWVLLPVQSEREYVELTRTAGTA